MLQPGGSPYFLVVCKWCHTAPLVEGIGGLAWNLRKTPIRGDLAGSTLCLPNVNTLGWSGGVHAKKGKVIVVVALCFALAAPLQLALRLFVLPVSLAMPRCIVHSVRAASVGLNGPHMCFTP